MTDPVDGYQPFENIEPIRGKFGLAVDALAQANFPFPQGGPNGGIVRTLEGREGSTGGCRPVIPGIGPAKSPGATFPCPPGHKW